MDERTGEAFANDERLTVVGRKLQQGQMAPDFYLEYLDLIEMTIHSTRLADSAGMVRLLSVVNSLERPVCHRQTRCWEELSASLPAGVCIYTISSDLPDAQARWQAREGVIHQTLSAHQDEQFGLAYGVWIKEWQRLQRSVFVIDRVGRLVYAEYVADQMGDPDYDAAVEAACKLL
ncbi:MAG TPA: redoxin family protein [Ktedonobacteraceae bacterium]|nr:redoxin family protein [Ktedonobacteraceae bacterium]